MATGTVEQLRAAVDELADADVVGSSQRDDLIALWVEMARLDAQFARRVAELDRSVEWTVDGARSAAGWLVAKLRTASGEAQHRVKVARQVAQMPITAKAWADGSISSRHVDAMTRVRHGAKADAEFAVFEPALVTVAREDRPEEVASVGQQWLDALDASRERDRSKSRPGGHDRRHANFSRSIFGMGFLDGTFDVEGAEIIDTALRRRYEQNHRADDPRTPGQQRADAIVDIFARDLDHQSRGTNRPHVVVVVDAATVSGEAVGCCETITGYRLHPDTVRRLACDSIIERIVLGADGVPLDMGRATRTFTPAQYRAIMLRDGGCRGPDCDAGPEACEVHHAPIAWEDGGRTDLSAGLAMCGKSGHHRMTHEGGWTITGDPNAEITFWDPDGNPQGTSRPRNPPKPIPTRTGNEITRARERAHTLRQPTASPRAA